MTLVASLAALNAFVIFSPVELLLVTRLLFKNDHWFKSVFAIATSSALGSLLLAVFIKYNLQYFTSFLDQNGVRASQYWGQGMDLVHRHGALGVAISCITFIPPSAAVAVATLAKVPLISIFFAAWLGRLSKYTAYGFIVVYFPNLIKNKFTFKGKKIN